MHTEWKAIAKIKLFSIITCDTVIRYLWWGFVETILRRFLECAVRRGHLHPFNDISIN